MLKKITKLQGLGLFANGTPTPADFDRTTLLYAENGRGKSTLAMLLRACARGDATAVLAKKTLNSATASEAALLFEFSGKNVPVTFSNGAWSVSVPQILVFDAEFVEQNVYSGQEVRPEQRQALLEFALGDQAVALQRQIGDLTAKIGTATHNRSDAERRIAAFAQQMTLAQFIGLISVPDAGPQIDALQKRIDAAKNAASIAARQSPVTLSKPDFDVDSFFAVLSKTLDDVERDAEAVVRNHFAKHAAPLGIESWISAGQVFSTGQDCPFCGQTLNGLAIIDAYKGYFNAAYAALKRQVAALAQLVTTGLADERIAALTSLAATNSARIDAWRDRLDIENPPWPSDSLVALIASARATAGRLAATKQDQPLVASEHAGERASIEDALAQIATAIDDYNVSIQGVNAAIEVFKKQLGGENIPALQAQIRSLEVSIARQHSDAIQAVADYQAAEAERKTHDTAKTQTRTQFDQLMAETLAQYQGQINALLATFGAGFTIEQMKANYQGTGQPRTEYALRLRTKTVPLGSRRETGAHFGSTLSEGDKRTLAFAFFLARVTADPAALQSQILVIDDPVSSLDRNRRAQTVELLTQLAAKSAQVIIMSHDAYFVREQRDMLSKHQPPISSRITAVERVQGDYSAFSTCDIDDLCASEYYRHHRLLNDYVAATYQGHIRDVAKAIRPYLEGYYHRRFPGLLPARSTFGGAIEEIARAAPGTAISYLQKHVQEMRALNKYASRFHHDTNPGNADTTPVTDGELKPYVLRALNLVYRG